MKIILILIASFCQLSFGDTVINTNTIANKDQKQEIKPNSNDSFLDTGNIELPRVTSDKVLTLPKIDEPINPPAEATPPAPVATTAPAQSTPPAPVATTAPAQSTPPAPVATPAPTEAIPPAPVETPTPAEVTPPAPVATPAPAEATPPATTLNPEPQNKTKSQTDESKGVKSNNITPEEKKRNCLEKKLKCKNKKLKQIVTYPDPEFFRTEMEFLSSEDDDIEEGKMTHNAYLENLSYNQYIEEFWNDFVTDSEAHKASEVKKYLDSYKTFNSKKHSNKTKN